MSATRVTFLFFVGLSLVTALMLSVAPLPDFMQAARPLWLALMLSYWVFELPYNFKISLAWVFGLAQDVLYGTNIGFHALFLAFVVYAILSFQQRLRMFPQWQQAIFLMLIYSIGQIFLLWLNTLAGHHTLVSQYIFPALVSGLLWPWVYMIMRLLRKLMQL